MTDPLVLDAAPEARCPMCGGLTFKTVKGETLCNNVDCWKPRSDAAPEVKDAQ